MQRTTRIAGFRASSIRHVCEHCRSQFRPARSDAKFCCNLCRQAASHKRKEVASAVDAAAVFQKRRKEALAVIDQFDRYQSLSVILHTWSKDHGLKLKAMGTPIGLVVAVDTDCDQWKGFAETTARGKIPRWFREIKTRSDDRELAALISIPAPVGSYIAKEAADEFRALLSRGPTDVSLFVEEWDQYWATQKPIALPTSAWSDDDERERDEELARDFDYLDGADDAHDIGTDSSGSLETLFSDISD